MIGWLFPLISPILFSVVVIILGFITPGYSHLNHTISRLAIERYGWIQSINFIQLAIGIYLTGMHFTKHVRDAVTVPIIRYTFIGSALFLLVAAFVPTDPIENVPLDFTLLSPTGLVHISLVVVFLILSPLGIVQLARVLRKQPVFARLGTYTIIAGFIALMGSIIWFALYFLGIYLQYRGIFQKAIAAPVIVWIVLLNHTLLRYAKTAR